MASTSSRAEASPSSSNFRIPEVETTMPETPQSYEKKKISKPIFGEFPECHFGPKGFIPHTPGAFVVVDPSSQYLEWTDAPQSVLLITDDFSVDCMQSCGDMVTWIITEIDLQAYVEMQSFHHMKTCSAKFNKSLDSHRHKIVIFHEDNTNLNGKIDMIVTIGSSESLIRASSFFQANVPPIMAFHKSSTGFLSPFCFSSYQKSITTALQGHVPLCIRTRLKCSICRFDSAVCEAVKTMESKRHILVLNDVVIDRGASAYLCHLDLYIEKELATTIQGDGVIISSPTGSTAYSSAAGSSLVHPSIPSILITPICSHSLSFRPILVPAGVEVAICVSELGRSSAWASFDGQHRMKLEPGDLIRISTSIYPVPCISSKDQIRDWFHSLDTCLEWNVTKRYINVLEPEDESFEETIK